MQAQPQGRAGRWSVGDRIKRGALFKRGGETTQCSGHTKRLQTDKKESRGMKGRNGRKHERPNRVGINCLGKHKKRGFGIRGAGPSVIDCGGWVGC